MNRPPELQQPKISHEEWELRLQDWLDGVATPLEAAAVQGHMAVCTICTENAQAMRQLDEQLSASVPPAPALGAQFDAQLFARIAAEESTRRPAVTHATPEAELAALRRAWRARLLKIAAVAAVLFVGLTWLLLSGAVPFLSPAAIAVAVATVTPVQWLSAGLVGGVAAMLLARLLQPS